MRVRIHAAMWLLVSMACVGTGCALAQRVVMLRALAGVPRVPMDEFKRLHAVDAVLVVDVRDDASYRRGHIPGAIGVPLEAIAQYAGEIRARAMGRPIVTYCSCLFDDASARAAAALIKRGLRNSGALVGGYPEWVATGGPIERVLLDNLHGGLVGEKLLKGLVRFHRDHPAHAVVTEAAQL